MKRSILGVIASISGIAYGCFQYIHTQHIDIDKALVVAQQENLQMPNAFADGRVPTLNNMGASTPTIDPITCSFLAECTAEKTVLEIGACYGLVCIKALEQGCHHYIANDCDKKHLCILAQTIQKQNPALLSRLALELSMFPEGTDVADSSCDAILLARVLHFMHPKELDASISKLKSLLKSGGKVYALTLSPYTKGYAPFIPEFERRKNVGADCPGFVESKRTWADESILEQRVLDGMKGSMLFFDTDYMQQLFERHGFIVEKCTYLPLEYPSTMWSLDGRENVGLIAQKP